MQLLKMLQGSLQQHGQFPVEQPSRMCRAPFKPMHAPLPTVFTGIQVSPPGVLTGVRKKSQVPNSSVTVRT